MNSNDPQWSYLQHHEHDSEMLKENKLPSCYDDPESIDAWRHMRMHNTILPLIKAFPDATWLTVGDGKYGSDAYFLKTRGANVTASSLSAVTLLKAQELGYLDSVVTQNAEAIDAPDNAYDFVFCKEAYHHFPRPPVAFYEMLRVCRKGVVLIEPLQGRKRLLDYLKIVIKKLLRKDASMLFEPSGNYIYKVNLEEISRMMTALNFELVSYKTLNDFYHSTLSSRPFRPGSFATVATRCGILVQNVLCRARLMNYGLASVIAFKKAPKDSVIDELHRNNFTNLRLPINPYQT